MVTLLDRPDRMPSAAAFGTTLTIDELSVTLEPGALNVPLFLPPRDCPAEPPSLWHTVAPPRGCSVTLTSTSEAIRILHLSVASNDARWRDCWPRWSYAVRRAPELTGGSAVDAQDRLAADTTSLRLLLLPGETRIANLEFPAELDGETVPGTYKFAVVLTDVTGAQGVECAQVSGELTLRHPDTMLLDLLPSIYREAMDEMDEQHSGKQQSLDYLELVARIQGRARYAGTHPVYVVSAVRPGEAARRTAGVAFRLGGVAGGRERTAPRGAAVAFFPPLSARFRRHAHSAGTHAG